MNTALVYDGQIRDNGTPFHTRLALAQVLGTEPEWYTEAAPIPNTHDFYVHVDDGRDDLSVSHIPHPWGYWAIDSHLGPDIRISKARQADITWCAQKPFAAHLHSLGLNAHWLPLACEPLMHRAIDRSPEYDLVFVGHLQPPPSTRIPFLDALFKAFPNSWLEWGAFHEDMSRAYSKARVGVNHAVRDDLNMRFFELGAIGVPQLCDSRMEGLSDLGFKPLVHYFPYDSVESAIAGVQIALDTALDTATPLQHLILSQHTYRHRVERMLEQAEHLWRHNA